MTDSSADLRPCEIQDAFAEQPIIGHRLAHRDGNICGQPTERLTDNQHAPLIDETGILGQTHWVAVGKLTPGLIHEINNALCVVSNYLQLLALEGERRGWDISNTLAPMRHSIERAQTISHRVAEYVKGSTLPPSRLRVNGLLEEALALALLQRTFQGLPFHKSFADNLPDIQGDCGSLMDVFLELLVNAAQALERGSALTIATESTAHWVVVSLSGVGRWQQYSEESLILIRQLLERQGGHLSYSPRPANLDWQLSVWLRASSPQLSGGGSLPTGRAG